MKTMGQRLAAGMRRAGLEKPADLARAANTSTATASNWLTDQVVPEHVKALQLFKMADAAKMDPRELLLGEAAPPHFVADPAPASQPLQLDQMKIAFQLVAEALDGQGLTLPPAKRAEVTLLAYDLLIEGLPQAKVLRFVKAAAA
ncbi:MAG: transcriptional regulator [Xanthomonadales bacterium]|nr:transcriptional regulator [Xanthomonadales bacterium]